MEPMGVDFDSNTYRKTKKVRHRYWVRNMVQNMKTVWNSSVIPELYDVVKGVPAMVIGAGPSLESNLDLIREVQGRFNIISTNSPLKLLKKAGINPLFVAGAEFRNHSNCFSDLDGLTDMFGFFSVFCHPSFFEPPFRAIFTCNEASFELGKKVFGRLLGPPLPRIINVSSLAMFLAYTLGAREILFFGQDLAFPKGQTYADGTTGAPPLDDKEHWGPFQYVSGVNGGTVLTGKPLGQCIEPMSILAGMLKQRGVTCYNVDSRGAQINNLENISFRSWLIDHFPTVRFSRDALLNATWKRPADFEELGLLISRMEQDMEILLYRVLSPPFDHPQDLTDNIMLSCFLPEEYEEIRRREDLDEKKGCAIRILEALKAARI